MKLSKAQQEVVDKMREGYAIFYGYTNDWLRKGNSNSTSVWKSTTNSLLKRGIIEPVPGSQPACYRLTEQYKTKNK